jgi:hypothetical protein
VIVVIGTLAWRTSEPEGPAGRAAAIGLAAAAGGSRVELVARVGDDEAGGAALLALAQAGVGHAAVLRDPARATPLSAAGEPEPELSAIDADGPTTVAALVSDRPPEPRSISTDDLEALAPMLEPADVSLGLRYLTEFRVVVVTDGLQDSILPVAAEAAGYAAAHLVVLEGRAEPIPDSVPTDSTVLAVPDDDPDGAFAALVGAYASALDHGLDPGEAFRASTGERGWEPIALRS